jgi:SAM-dependent methyltransferase
VFVPLSVIALAIAIYLLREAMFVKLGLQIAGDLVALGICCMTCHGELVRKRPAPQHLTLFYLTVAAGGALGGIGVAVVAPALFDGYWEYHLALAACFVFPALSAFADGLVSQGRRFTWVAGGAIVVIASIAAAFLAIDVRETREKDVARSRSFYGVLRVSRETYVPLGESLTLWNGRIKHGIQFLAENSRYLPTTYYGPESGVGLAIRYHARRAGGSLRVGAVGLGVGTIAAYGQTGDVFRFYEIDPGVVAFAREHFTYLSHSDANVDVVLGDARLRLEEEAEEAGALRYDILAVDAFSGDAIPTHLLTAECADLYERRLQPDGLLLFHITNRYVDLKPVVTALARHLGRGIVFFSTKADDKTGTAAAVWAVLAHLDTPLGAAPPAPAEAGVLWTDEYQSLLPLLKFH